MSAPGGCLLLGGVCSGGSALGGCLLPGGGVPARGDVCSQGVPALGGCLLGGGGCLLPGDTVAGSTHPSGMHSCFTEVQANIKLISSEFH